MGRPSKLTPVIVSKLVQAIRLGATYRHACNYAGIHYDTFNEWMKKGRKAKSGKYSEFSDSIRDAEGSAIVGWLAKIEKAASEGTWQAAAWKAERRYPNDYGKQVKQDITTGGEKLNQPERGRDLALQAILNLTEMNKDNDTD